MAHERTKLRAEDVVGIDWNGEGMPHSIWTYNNKDGAEEWDIDFCRNRNQWYYHNSGSGRNDAATEYPLSATPTGFDLAAFIDNAIESKLAYCKVCDDSYPEEVGSVCRHLGDDAEDGCWHGCGSTDLEPDDHKESFVRYVSRVPAALPKLRKALAGHKYDTWLLLRMARPDYDVEGDDEWADERATGWLWSLEAGKTDEFDDITVAWINEAMGTGGTA